MAERGDESRKGRSPDGVVLGATRNPGLGSSGLEDGHRFVGRDALPSVELVDTIENQIIPRLMLGRAEARRLDLAVCPPEREAPTPVEIERLADRAVAQDMGAILGDVERLLSAGTRFWPP